MESTRLKREFKFGEVTLSDPNPDFSENQVKEFYSGQYPELVNANIKGPEVTDESLLYTFGVEVGKKG